MIVVIADDITGAAEMAGVAFDYGLRVRLVLGLDEGLPVADVVVVATDTRSMSASQAVAVTKEVMVRLLMHAKERMPFPVLFKKTDSALRGHVMEELEAILASGPYKKAVFLPANPSRGRVIRDGKYYCGDVPISKTDFAFDPEFPALTDSMVARFPDAARLGVWMPDASSVGEIEAVVAGIPHDTLLAGAADLFEALLVHRGHSRKAMHSPMALDAGDTLVVAGSTQSQPSQLGLPVETMPREVYDGVAGAAEWIHGVLPVYLHSPGMVLAIPFRHLTGKEVAVRLRQTMADVVRTLVTAHPPTTLVLEGGATAYCCLESLSWRQFAIAEVYAPGVIRMVTPQSVSIILKPGSYPWPVL